MPEKKTKKKTKMFVVQSMVREYLISKGYRTAGETPERLSLKVEMILDDAAQRVTQNGRKTVEAYDL